MENQLLNMIQDLQEKERSLVELHQQIKTQEAKNEQYLLQEKERLESEMFSFNKEKAKKSMELDKLLNQNTVSIPLSNLVEELSKLSGISILNMGIKLDFFSVFGVLSCIPLDYNPTSFLKCHIKYNDVYYGPPFPPSFIDDMDSLLNCEYHRSDRLLVFISIYGDNSLEYVDIHQPFCYRIMFPFNPHELQADGQMFLRHCSPVFEYEDKKNQKHYHIKVDKRIGDIICHIDMEKVIRGDEENWRPSSLLIEAIMNCVKQGKYVTPTVEPKEKQKVLK